MRSDDTAIDPVVPGRTTGRLAEQAYIAILNAIAESKLKPGQRVLEVELAAWLRMSRTPVREALRRLQSDGMVMQAGGGLAVAQHDMLAIAELYDLRESMEGTAASLAARYAGPADMVVLQTMIDGAKRLGDDPIAHSRENLRLHDQIYRSTHNRFLLKQVHDLHGAVALLGRTTYAQSGRIEEAWAEHAGIVAAITNRDAGEAERLMREHVRRGHALRVQAMIAAES